MSWPSLHWNLHLEAALPSGRVAMWTPGPSSRAASFGGWKSGLRGRTSVFPSGLRAPNAGLRCCAWDLRGLRLFLQSALLNRQEEPASGAGLLGLGSLVGPRVADSLRLSHHGGPCGPQASKKPQHLLVVDSSKAYWVFMTEASNWKQRRAQAPHGPQASVLTSLLLGGCGL